MNAPTYKYLKKVKSWPTYWPKYQQVWETADLNIHKLEKQLQFTLHNNAVAVSVITRRKIYPNSWSWKELGDFFE